MLIQFIVENHRSIKNSAVISFEASKDKSFEEYLLHPDAKKHCCLRLLFTVLMLPERAMCYTQ